MAGSLDEAFLFAGTYLVNLDAAVQALPQVRERLSDPNASEFLKRIAVRTAIMLARPESSDSEQQPINDVEEPLTVPLGHLDAQQAEEGAS